MILLAERPDLIRSLAMELIELYVPSETGDSRFQEISKDYLGSGTTCGFLCHWLLWKLGCRTSGLVNRTDPESHLEYKNSRNISMLRWNRFFKVYSPGVLPEPGDIVLLSNGPPATEHVFVFCGIKEVGNTTAWLSADAGQRNKKGQQCAKFMERMFTNPNLLDGRRIQGWLCLTELSFTSPISIFYDPENFGKATPDSDLLRKAEERSALLSSSCLRHTR
jgi:hypothetical protein